MNIVNHLIAFENAIDEHVCICEEFRIMSDDVFHVKTMLFYTEIEWKSVLHLIRPQKLLEASPNTMFTVVSRIWAVEWFWWKESSNLRQLNRRIIFTCVDEEEERADIHQYTGWIMKRLFAEFAVVFIWNISLMIHLSVNNFSVLFPSTHSFIWFCFWCCCCFFSLSEFSPNFNGAT